MKNLIKTIGMSILLIASLSLAQEGDATKVQKFEQLKNQVKVEECVNISEAEKAQIQEAKAEMKKLQDRLANCKSESEKAKVMDQIKTQVKNEIQKSIQNYGFDEATKARITKAIQEMEQKVEQKQAQFKDK